MFKLISILFILILSGCASRSVTSPNPVLFGTNSNHFAPLGDKKIENYTIQLYSSPSSPVRGRNVLKVHLENSNGQPISDAKISFDLDMTNMSHGKNIVPATPLGSGDYQGNVNFMMPGPWRVLVGIEQGGQTSTVRFDFIVKSQ